VTTSANIELARSIYAAWQRGDFSSTDWAHPEIAFEIGVGPTPGSWKGLAAMGQAWREFISAWENYRVEVDEYRELGDDRVLVLTRQFGTERRADSRSGRRERGVHMYSTSRMDV
jgi:hypothetical protein